ncbi:sigma-54 dependent transcriptional regulator [Desulfobacterales bacterium HSG16]|nr:sigma-54 dependent transcriptional regulator [Desulfobacterales bacterium HSG16]
MTDTVNTLEALFKDQNILVIDDEQNMRHMLNSMLKTYGFHVDTAPDGVHALEMVKKKSYDFILCDMKMPNMGGMEFLKAAKSNVAASTVIMMSAYGSLDNTIEAMKLGAYDYISKPFKSDEVCLTLKKAEEREHLKKENIQLKERISKIEASNNFGSMIAKSKAMQSIFKLAVKVSQYNTTVLITGESGTGKELIAKGLHFSGTRAKKAFVPINCGGIPENLLESEFFGHVRGAFTGAEKAKKGLFEEADHGTIFLDEIGELPITLQVKLLRVLQENEVRRIGDSKLRTVDVRVIAATSKNLEEEVSDGNFRQDLFYRLNVLPIKLPALRVRTEDIPLLCQHFIEKIGKALNKRIDSVAPDAMSVLLKHSWPGNVRELENAIERAAVLTDETILTIDNFPPELLEKTESNRMNEIFDGYSIKAGQKILEKMMIKKALTATDGNRSKATRLLEISHPSLLNKIKAYDIDA